MTLREIFCEGWFLLERQLFLESRRITTLISVFSKINIGVNFNKCNNNL